MAWIYFQEAEDSQKDCTDGCVQSPIVKSSQELSACSCPAWPEENYTQPPYGMMCGRCDGIFSPRWISSPGVSHARTLALQALERAWLASEADLYLITSASLASANPDSCSWKTSQLSLFGGLTEFSWNSMHWGMMHDGLLFQLQRWAPRISDSESGYSPIPGTHVPTPTATAISNSRTAAKDGSMHGVSLAHFVRMWPTPVASEGEKGGPGRKHGDGSPTLSRAVHLWTTPCVDDTSHRKEKYAQGGTAMSTQAGGQLNPTWVEWLMGWPIGSTVCESWVTESSHFARRKRL